MILEAALSELTLEEDRRQTEFDLAQRVIWYGREEDRRIVARNRDALQEILDGNRQGETLSNVQEESGAIGEAQGNGN